MATTINFINYVCEQLKGVGVIRYRKMFGEYMVYVNDKPIIIVCDNTVYVKKLDCISKKMNNADVGYPYKGAKEHYVLNIDDSKFSKNIVETLLLVTPLPKKKK